MLEPNLFEEGSQTHNLYNKIHSMPTPEYKMNYKTLSGYMHVCNKHYN